VVGICGFRGGGESARADLVCEARGGPSALRAAAAICLLQDPLDEPEFSLDEVRCFVSFGVEVTTHLAHIRDCKTASGTNWSNRWTNREGLGTAALCAAAAICIFLQLQDPLDEPEFSLDEVRCLKNSKPLAHYSRTMPRAIWWP
jgi:hypothetical protein